MNPKAWIPALITALVLTSCSATQRRISAHEDLFDSYSPQDQAMIKSQRIARGFDSTQVYLAWGNADSTQMVDGQEVWHYHQLHRRTDRIEKSAEQYRLEMAEWENAKLRGETVGNEPQTFTLVTWCRTGVAKTVRFEDGVVVGWEEPKDVWVDDWHQ